jgi:hypothetical protein
MISVYVDLVSCKVFYIVNKEPLPYAFNLIVDENVKLYPAAACAGIVGVG